jgi:hypothetical protein
MHPGFGTQWPRRDPGEVVWTESVLIEADERTRGNAEGEPCENRDPYDPNVRDRCGAGRYCVGDVRHVRRERLCGSRLLAKARLRFERVVRCGSGRPSVGSVCCARLRRAYMVGATALRSVPVRSVRGVLCSWRSASAGVL